MLVLQHPKNEKGCRVLSCLVLSCFWLEFVSLLLPLNHSRQLVLILKSFEFCLLNSRNVSLTPLACLSPDDRFLWVSLHPEVSAEMSSGWGCGPLVPLHSYHTHMYWEFPSKFLLLQVNVMWIKSWMEKYSREQHAHQNSFHSTEGNSKETQALSFFSYKKVFSHFSQQPVSLQENKRKCMRMETLGETVYFRFHRILCFRKNKQQRKRRYDKKRVSV